MNLDAAGQFEHPLGNIRKVSNIEWVNDDNDDDGDDDFVDDDDDDDDDGQLGMQVLQKPCNHSLSPLQLIPSIPLVSSSLSVASSLLSSCICIYISK